ncbi:GNAT family N-acetyltransferase [Erwinia sorbitola]|uniref:GNAT family N-acetyltransferase n=1 Tax=Erwinia sorbitola TaxID=2681984 RepID=A0A6I6F388_9GAMM|nr:GNAT family N-acetyltransferase [Erwinia sorbitola]QGU88300.1 GNAT family N-acetyltransferase [Erwinia sorbitola]
MSLPQADVIVRAATAADIDAITRIYAWHVLHGCGSFEETPPDAAEMAARYQKVSSLDLPWLVAELEGKVVGYCYATQYRPRPAYRFTVEDSVYIDAEMGGRGIGSALLEALINRCQQGPFRQMLAIIGNGERNAGSLNLHKKMGFEIVGNFRAVGFKHGEWRDTLLMQRAL